METCYHNGEELCAYDLKDQSGYYINDKVTNWKLAASKGGLICSDCGQRVYLAAGPIREPYFAHYDLQSCSYSEVVESEELRKGKRLIYHVLKRSFPEGEIHSRYRMENGMYSTFFIISHDQRSFAIDYRLQHNSLEQFMERDKYYKEHNIIPIYILGIRKISENQQISWYENLLQDSTGICIYLNGQRETVVLKKQYEYHLGTQRVLRFVQFTYPISEINIMEDGFLHPSFQKECQKLEAQIRYSLDEYERKIEDERRAEEAKRLEAVKQMEENKKNQAFVVYQGVELRKDMVMNAIRCIQRGEPYLVSRIYMEYIKEHGLA